MKHTICRWLGIVALAAIVVAAVPSTAAAETPGTTPELQALEWRFVGPIVGGRGTSVAGHPTDPNVFYFGSSSGGLWKTEDAGQYWEPVGDGQFKMGAVGAMALYEKNPDVLYVGMFLYKGLYPTAGLYLCFLYLAVLGLTQWNRSMKRTALAELPATS